MRVNWLESSAVSQPTARSFNRVGCTRALTVAKEPFVFDFCFTFLFGFSFGPLFYFDCVCVQMRERRNALPKSCDTSV